MSQVIINTAGKGEISRDILVDSIFTFTYKTKGIGLGLGNIPRDIGFTGYTKLPAFNRSGCDAHETAFCIDGVIAVIKQT